MTDRADRDLHPNLADAAAEEADAAAMDALARRLAELGPEEALVDPPADLFTRIQAELAADGAPAAAPAAAPMELSTRRRPRALVLVGAGVAAAVALVVGILVLPEDEPATRTEVVALEPLPGFEQAAGSASVVIAGDERTVGVDLTDVDVPAGSHLELWLLDPAVEQLVPLGVIDGAAAHRIPDDVDLGVTPIVDVSIEQDDGNPAHSGVSVVRGQIA